MRTLPHSFYRRPDVTAVARDLLGKVLATHMDHTYAAGIITETEAYAGETDRASHAYGGKVTERIRVMYGPGGFAYIYLCYGIHHLFNVVTDRQGIAHAVLVRAIQPLEGHQEMLRRRGGTKLTTGGPGTLTQALGIRTEHNGADLSGPMIRIEDRGIRVRDEDVQTGPRVGVDYAGPDALLPYRFRTVIRHLA